MSKKTIKNIFNEKLNKEKMHENIMKKIEGKKENRMKNVFKIAVPTLVALIICGITFLNETKTNTQLKGDVSSKIEENNISINQIDDAGAPKIDGALERLDVQENYFNIPDFEVLSDLSLPKDMNKVGGEKLFGRKDKNSKVYDKLVQYQFHYFNEDNTRNITVAFSDTNKPVRDYRLPDSGKISTIHGVTLKLYQYKDIYMTEFQYKGYNFDIETSGITEKEFIKFLESLIK